MFTDAEDISLSEVLTKLGAKEELKPASIDAKKADNDALRNYFATVLPNYDRDRVYPSDIRKLVLWYNILINAGITDFTVDEDSEDTPKQDAPVAKEEKKIAPKAQVKTQKSAAKASAKTGVGAKKG